MLENLNLEELLFIDIETVPQFSDFNAVPEKFQNLWEKKAAYFLKDEMTPADVYQSAGIYAEFGKIICISVGMIIQRHGEPAYRVKSYYGEDEKLLLSEFGEMLQKYTTLPHRMKLCAHNGIEFDFPYIARRMLINGIKLPSILSIAGAKPWEVKETLIDTLQLWKFGDYKHYTSLNLLCAVFNIPTPKDDIDGSDVARVYYEEKDIKRIVRYCEKDTLAVAQLMLRYQGKDLIPADNMEIVE